MGFYESQEEILASAHNLDTALIGWADRIITRLGSGALYIHAILTDSESNDTYEMSNFYRE
jgi:hypothetical protein